MFHMAATAGATANQVDSNVSILDVRPVAGGLLFMRNVDAVGQFGDALFAGRDGTSSLNPLATGAPVGGLLPVSPLMPIPPTTWVCPHLGGATIDKDKRFIDTASPEPHGALSLITMASGHDAAVDASVRAGQFVVSDDQALLAYVSGAMLDATQNNFVGTLKQAPVAMPTMASMPILGGVSELGSVVGKQMFVDAPKAATPGVYFVKF
jgi:hypothetical protein